MGKSTSDKKPETASLTQTTLFVARTNGYWIYRIPGVVTAPKGVILAYCEARYDHGSDWAPSDILLRRSTDDGLTWQPPRCLVSFKDYGQGPMNNPVCVADRETGCVSLLFCHNYARAFVMHSDDGGIHWTAPREITDVFEAFRSRYDWGVIAIGPGHGIQLSSGRLLVPIWLSESKTHAHRPNRAAVIYSDDHGESWQAGGMVPDKIPNCNETEAVELSNGAILLNMRNMGPARRRAASISWDGGTEWSEPFYLNDLLEPRCFGSICSYPHAMDGRFRLLFANPDNLRSSLPDHPFGFADRKRLTIKVSYDQGCTWPVAKVLEPGYAGYADLAVTDQGHILCFYERGHLERGQTDTQSLCLARFNLAWVESR